MSTQQKQGQIMMRGEIQVKQVSTGEAMRMKYPEWIVLVVARDSKGKANLMPAGWGMVCSGKPLMVCVAIGHGRYTHKCIEDTAEFVFAWAGEGQAELVKYAGSHTGAKVDKFREFNIPTAPAAVVDVPLLAEAAANLECRLHRAVSVGDHTIFVGEVVAAHLPNQPIAKLDNFSGAFAVAQPVER